VAEQRVRSGGPDNDAIALAVQSVRLGFDCIFHYVADVDAAVPFYRDVLELELVSQDVVARFDIDGVRFELVRDSRPEPRLVGGNGHLCLGVSDMKEAQGWLRRKGVELSPPEAVQGGLLATFKDPDGNEIYVWQAT
jgi:catechol 2,3-dioxygenase-like lactoylglutathione lyase family enzyme